MNCSTCGVKLEADSKCCEDCVTKLVNQSDDTSQESVADGRSSPEIDQTPTELQLSDTDHPAQRHIQDNSAIIYEQPLHGVAVAQKQGDIITAQSPAIETYRTDSDDSSDYVTESDDSSDYVTADEEDDETNKEGAAEDREIIANLANLHLGSNDETPLQGAKDDEIANDIEHEKHPTQALQREGSDEAEANAETTNDSFAGLIPQDQQQIPTTATASASEGTNTLETTSSCILESSVTEIVNDTETDFKPEIAKNNLDESGANATADNQSNALDKDPSGNEHFHFRNDAHVNVQTPEQGDSVAVNFHVIVPPDFKTTGAQLVIKRASDWHNNDYWVCEKVRHIPKQYVLYTGEFHIPRAVLREGFQYKYCVVTGPHESDLEYRYGGYDRNLCIQDFALNNIARWDQFDGVLQKKKKTNVIKRIGNYVLSKDYKQLVSDNRLALMAFLPTWSGFRKGAVYGERQPAHEIVDQIMQVYKCMKPNLLNRDGDDDDTLQMAVVLEKYIETRINSYKQITGPETAAEAGLRMSSALIIVWLVITFNLNMSSIDYNIVCHALIPRIDPEKTSLSDLQEVENYHFPERASMLTNIILQFMERGVTMKSASGFTSHAHAWLFLVPLFHFLSQESRPYKPVLAYRYHRSKPWYGLANVSAKTKKYKMLMINQPMPISNLLKHLGPLFEVDMFLPRTLMTVMSPHHLPKAFAEKSFPVEVCLATLFYFINSNAIKPGELHKYLTPLEHKLIAQMERVHAVDRKEKEALHHYCSSVYDIALDVLNEVMKVSSSIHYASIAHAAKMCIVALECVCSTMGHEEGHAEYATEKFEQLGNRVLKDVPLRLDWPICAATYQFNIAADLLHAKELRVWSSLLSVKCKYVPDTALEAFQRPFCNTLQKRVEKMSEKQKLEMFVNTNFTELHPHIEAMFRQVAFEGADELLKSPMDNYYISSGPSKVGELFSSAIVKSWPKDDSGCLSEDKRTCMPYILQWTELPQCLNMFYVNTDNTKLLTDECQKAISIASTTMQDLRNGVLSGSIFVMDLRFVLQYKDNFVHTASFLEGIAEEKTEIRDAAMTFQDAFRKLLDIRENELHVYETQRQLISKFVHLCGSEGIQIKNRGALKLEGNIDGMPLKTLYQPLTLAEAIGNVSYPRITRFKNHVSADTLQMMYYTDKVQDSHIFKHLWRQHCTEASYRNEMAFEYIQEHLWHPVYSTWCNLAKKFYTGDISVVQVETHFGEKHYDEGVVDHEFAIISEMHGQDIEWINRRKEQLAIYYQIRVYRESAWIFTRMKDTFKLQGDFQKIEMLQALDYSENSLLNSMNLEMIDVGRNMEGIGPQQVACLRVFLDCMDLTNWLTTNIKDATEITTLVELAMNSAEGDQEVEQVSILNAAVTGYTPLLYDLEPEMGFAELLAQCRCVWRVLEQDPGLPEKFKFSNSCLNWVKEIKESHGDIEVNSFIKVKDINEAGIIQVGCLDNNVKHRSLDNVIQLHFIKEDNSEEDSTQRSKRPYPLQKLQSKLMLISGKAASDRNQEHGQYVERFVSILDAAIRLGNWYLKLCKSGCILFQDWKVTFFCNP